MGKFIMLMVGAVLLGVSYLVFSNQRTSYEIQDEQSDYQYQDIAITVAKSGFDRGVSAIRRDLMGVADSFPETALGDGYYNLRTTKNFYGDVDLEVDAYSGEAEYDVAGNVIFTVPLPAAVQLEDEEVDVGGTCDFQISGVDRRMPSTKAGPGFRDPTRGIMTTYSNRDAFTSSLNMNNVVGIGSSPGDPANTGSVEGGFTFNEADVEALYQEARLNANTTISPLVLGILRETMLQTAVLGSGPGNPRIIRVQGDLTVTSSLQGYGMLIIEDGDLNIAAPDFDWEGLILIRKEHEDTVAVSLQNTEIYGGLIAYDYDSATLLPECVPDFDVYDDHAVVNDSFRVRVKVLGAAITAGGSYDMPVTARLNIGGTLYEPWGDYSLPLDGNINTGNSGVTYSWEPDIVFPAGSSVIVDAKSWEKIDGQDGDQNSEWQVAMERNSQSNDQQLQVLEDAAAVPSVGGFMGQYSVEEFLADYIQNDHMVLTANQVVNLFEIGTTDTGSSAFDMQDAVVLVTLVKAGNSACTASASGSRLEFNVGTNTEIHYSSEAIAKLGLTLNEVADDIDVRVVRSILTGGGKGETPTYQQSLTEDDHEEANLDSGNSDKVTICHIPPGNPSNAHTITVGEAALGAHIGHGDYVGACSVCN